MSDEYQKHARMQDTEKPGEREELERQRREREEFEKRVRGGRAALAAAAGDYGERISEGATTYEDYEEKISEAALAAKDYVSDKVSVVGDRFKDLQNADLGELAENAKDYVRQNPGTAMLISAAAGVLLGLQIGRAHV